MTEQEYRSFVLRMFTLWPSLAEWFARLEPAKERDADGREVDPEVNPQEGIRERWRLCLMPLDRSACEDAIKSLAAGGEDPWPYPSDKERAAAIVADLARRSSWTKRMADVRLKEDQQRFYCLACRDTGEVSCYRAKEVYWIAKLQRLPYFARSYAARCSCRAGQQIKVDSMGREYDPELDVARDLPPKEIITTCVAIVERIEEHASRVGADGRVAAFDAFNQGAVA